MIMASKSQSYARSSLQKIKVPEGVNRKNWQPINHGTLANTVVTAIEAKGLVISDEKYYVNPKKTILWGSLDIEPGQALPSLQIGQEAKFSLGLRHGNDGEYAVSFAVGARIVVCSNGMFMGDYVMKKKHTPSLNLREHVDSAIERYIQECESLETLINEWRGAEISDRDAAYLMLKTHEEGHINFSYLETVDDCWRNPRNEEFQPRTAWSLYNAFTQAVTEKQLTAPRQMKVLTGLRRVFDNEFTTSIQKYEGQLVLDI